VPKHGKKYREAATQVEKSRLYSPHEAIDLLKKISYSAFDGTVEVHMHLGVDPRHADQMVRGTAVLPHGTGRTVRVLVFAKGEKVKEAESAGADYVGAEDLAEKIQGGWMDFDVAVATPDLMSVVGRLGRTLGPRGLMPSPKAGTVTFDIAKAVKEIKAGKIEYRTEKTGILHAGIGKASFTEEQLLANFTALLEAVVRAKPAASKGQYLRSIAISTTMGPGIHIDPVKAEGMLQAATA